MLKQNRMIIHNNLFHCRRGSWDESDDWKTPPRGAGPTDEDKALDTYNLYDYDWVSNMWIKKMKNIEDMDTMEQEILPVVLIWEKREAEMVKEKQNTYKTLVIRVVIG